MDPKAIQLWPGWGRELESTKRGRNKVRQIEWKPQPLVDRQEYERLIGAVPRTDELKSLRDRALLDLAVLFRLKPLELHQANLQDLEYQPRNQTFLWIREPGLERRLALQGPLWRHLLEYLEARGLVFEEEEGTPLFCTVGPPIAGQRISVSRVQKLLSFYFRVAGLDRTVVS